jgi:hypothetical protein
MHWTRRFTPDGKKLVYFVSDSASSHRGELWIADLDTGLNERLLPGFSIGTGGRASARSAFDVSHDGQWVAFEAVDTAGKSRIWLATLDRRAPPRQIPNVEGDAPVVRSKRRRPIPRPRSRLWLCVPCPPGRHRPAEVHEHPVIENIGVTPDGRWLAVYARPTKERAGGTILLPVEAERPCRCTGRALASGGRGMDAFCS